jgi:periplasmic protein CpxP/Spy
MEKPAMRPALVKRFIPLFVTPMLLAAPTWAQTAGGATAEPGHPAVSQASHSASTKQPTVTMESIVERHIADMHGKLHITPEQTQQWDQFAQVMRDNAKDMDQAYRQRAEKMTAMSAVDNMQSYVQLEQQRLQDVQKLEAPFQALYASLSDQQKKTVDELFRTYAASAQTHRQAAAR